MLQKYAFTDAGGIPRHHICLQNNHIYILNPVLSKDINGDILIKKKGVENQQE